MIPFRTFGFFPIIKKPAQKIRKIPTQHTDQNQNDFRKHATIKYRSEISGTKIFNIRKKKSTYRGKTNTFFTSLGILNEIVYYKNRYCVNIHYILSRKIRKIKHKNLQYQIRNRINNFLQILKYNNVWSECCLETHKTNEKEKEIKNIGKSINLLKISNSIIQ